ncbi:MAG: hypothetical protein WB502_12400 [Thermoactinomyces sp.]
MRFFSRRALMIIILSIILLIVSFTAFYQFSIRSNIMKAQLKDIQIKPLENSIRSKESLNSYRLSEAEKEEIWNNINEYKKVIYTFEIKNNSWLAYSVHHRVQPQFSEETNKLLVVSEKNFFFVKNLPTRESYKTILRAIIKTNNQLSDQEILDIVSKDRFTIIGNRVGIFSAKPVGDESITVGPFQRNQ